MTELAGTCPRDQEKGSRLALALASGDNGADETAASEKAIGGFKKLTRVRQGKHLGWLQFCAQIGVNPDAIAAPFQKDVEWAMEAAKAIAELPEEDSAAAPSNVEEIAQRELAALIDAWGTAD